MRRLPSWSKNILAIYYHFLISVQYKFLSLIKHPLSWPEFLWPLLSGKRLEKEYDKP